MRFRTLVLFAFFALFSISCTGPSKQKIGFVVTTLANPYFVDVTNAAKQEAAKHPNVDLIVQAPPAATDTDRQVQIIEDLIAQRVQALCVVPADSKSVIPVIKKANNANIPFLVLDNKVDPTAAASAGIHTASFIGSDNFLGGQLAGQYIAKRLDGKGTVAILEGVSGVEAAVQRKAGFQDAIKQFPGLQVVASQPADWDREKALNTTQALLQAHPDLSAIFASNDEMALGALQALKQSRSAKKPIVVGFDAIKEALQAVQAGTLAATVAQMPAEVGRLGVSTAVDVIEGKSVPAIVPTPVKLVTSENVGDFLH